MGFNLADTIDLLARTPKVLHALLGGIPVGWASSDEGPGTWTPSDVVGHLIHGEQDDWIPRALHAVQHGTDVPWPSFDPSGAESIVAGLDLTERLDLFEDRRRSSLEQLASLDLTEGHLAAKAVHPTFGEVSLQQHLATWAAHDLDHLRQITRALALRHRDAIGPWKQFLTIMD